MSALSTLWSQLVQRRLWPVAILLIAALAAVPMALAKQPDTAVPPEPVELSDDGDTALTAQPIVAHASVAEQTRHPRVLGKPKNPFALPPKVTPSAAPKSSSVVNQSSSPTPPASSGGSPSSSGGGTPPSAATPPAAAPAPAPRRYSLYDLTVRFGDAATGSLQRSTLKRLQPLPSAEDPALIYLGVMKDGKTAVFLLDHGVVATGDGNCEPAPDTCETIQMRAGDTEFFDVRDATGAVTAQYQLDLVKIHKTATTSAKQAKASYAGSKSGRRLLAARASSEGPTAYRWDPATGTLQKLSRKVHAARVARALDARAGLARP